MVLRLFVPPGEGQHRLTPKRPDPIGANATPQYAVISSTALAAAYTSFASRYAQSVTPTKPISRPAVFIRASARLGVWAGVAGAALNWYYHSSFANVLASTNIPEVKPWKLYERTKKYTVDDGALAGAALGLAVSVPTLFMRRPAIPRWTRCLGMANIGACAGVLGAHAYFQYSGERQEAYKHFGRHVKRRSFEFWNIFWDPELMASLDPIMQQYVSHNSLWYTRWLSEEAFERAEQDVQLENSSSEPMAIAATPVEQLPPFYTTPFDYAEDLRRIDIESTLATMQTMEADKRELLREAEYLLYINAQQKYDHCHMESTDEDERQNLLRQIQLVDIAYVSLRNAAHDIDVKLAQWRMSVRHKTIWEAGQTTATGTDRPADWVPEPQCTSPTTEAIVPATHKPTYSMGELERIHRQISAEVKTFEDGWKDDRHPMDKRERWKKDAEDGRKLLRAADAVLLRLQRARETVEDSGVTVEAGVDSAIAMKEKEEEDRRGSRDGTVPAATAEVAELQEGPLLTRKQVEKASAHGVQATKASAGAFDKDKS
ncbi:uncharacterized protein J4E92_004623 [Alternaria infectoria]|uniref:uncharacterized protein n=1 Tax=Alternaria infectoria TaxID=45303 RepID=UPI00221E87DF|nr:uncharacterized protein J4E92_004623 [Alternaria infectoria]KAI4930791.1 hypothetical protein J4E92_004623 [Alternaria infectoria]